MTADERVPVHLANAWHVTMSTPEHWCKSCQEYRVNWADSLCPVCADDKRRGVTK